MALAGPPVITGLGLPGDFFFQLSKKVSLPLSDVNYHFWEIFKGESDTLTRTANLLHTLGTISVSISYVQFAQRTVGLYLARPVIQ